MKIGRERKRNFWPSLFRRGVPPEVAKAAEPPDLPRDPEPGVVKTDEHDEIVEIQLPEISIPTEVHELPRRKAPLVDRLFAHIPDGRSKFDWDRNVSGYGHVFMTDSSLTEWQSYSDKARYAWMLESPEVTAQQYKWLDENIDKFTGVLTCRKALLDKYPGKCRFVPAGSTWVEPKDRVPTRKTKVVSMVSSNKNFTTGHAVRHRIIEKYGQQFDLYGRGFNEVADKADALRDYMFSVAVENTSEDYYFTEKLLDCFATGTVPIYYGCPSIGDFFNPAGIIQVSSAEGVGKVLRHLNASLYRKMLPAVRENYRIFMERFVSYEDYMYDNYRGMLFDDIPSDGVSLLNRVTDEVYCINLDRRTDRWASVSEEFRRHGISATRWSAVDGQKLSGPFSMRHSDMPGDRIRGAVGCLRSHRGALQDAWSKGHQTVCVFEDDVVLQPDFNDRLARALQDVPTNWDMLYLGCHWHGLPEPVQVRGMIHRLRCFGVFGVMMRRNAIKRVLSITQAEEVPLDNYLYSSVQPGMQVYAVIPFLVKVSEDFSDIAGQFADYKIVSRHFY